MGRYLITGGAGFIGSNMVEALLQRGEYVRVLDNFSTGRRRNLAPFLKDIDLVEGDLRSYHTVVRAVRQVDYIVHLAALPSVPRSLHDPITTHDVNATGTLNLLHAAAEVRPRRLVYASSSSVYGDTEVEAKHEGLMPQPKSPYAVSKLAGEHYCRVFTEHFDVPCVALRYFNVFGPRQDPDSPYSAVIPRFIQAMLAGQSPSVYGDGSQTRDFTFVENVVEANLLACDAPNVAGRVFNVAFGDRVSLVQLVEELNYLLLAAVKPHFAAERAGDVRHSRADITAAGEHLFYRPKVALREGLERTIKFLRETELPRLESTGSA